MARQTEILALLIRADASGAIREFEKLGVSADRQLRTLEKSSDRTAATLMKAGAAAVAGGAIVARGMWTAASAAADLADAMQASDVIFGKNLQGSIAEFARHAEQNLGLSRREVQSTLQSFATFGKSAGLDGAPLLKFSEELTQVAADIASLKGVSNEDIMGAFSSALAGEIEPLRRIGINLTDLQKRAEAVKLGLRDAADSSPLTAQQQVLATVSLIKQSPLAMDAEGDFARTIDELPNQMKIARAEVENLKAEIGEGAVPVFRTLLGGARDLVDVFSALPAPLQQMVGHFAVLGSVGAVAGGSMSVLAGGAIKGSAAVSKLVTKARESEGGIKGMAGSMAGGLNPAMLAGTVAVMGGVAAWEAWSSANAAVEAGARRTTDEIMALTDATEAHAAMVKALREILEGDADSDSAFREIGLGVSEVTKAVSAAPGELDKFRDKVDGLTGPLENLDGMFGTGWFDSGGFDALRAAAQDLPSSLRAVVTAIIDAGESGEISNHEVRNLIDNLVDLDDRASKSSDTLASQARELWNLVPAAERSAAAQRALNTATDQTAGVEAQTAAWITLRDAFPAAAKEAGFATGAITELNAETSESSTVLAEGVTSLTRWANAARAGAEAAKGTGDSVATMAAKLRGAVDAQNALLSPALDYESALLRMQQAQQRLKQLQDPTANKEKIADMEWRRRDATDAVTDALDRQRKAQQELDRLQKRSAVRGSVPLLQEMAKVADEQMNAARRELELAVMSGGENSAGAVQARSAFDAASGRKGQSIELLNQALAESQQANTQARMDSAREVERAGRDVSRAVYDRSKVEREYGEILSQSGASSIEVRQAQLDVIRASMELDASLATLVGTVMDGGQPIEDVRFKLQQMADQGVISQEQLRLFNEQLDGVAVSVQKALPQVAALVDAVNSTPTGTGADRIDPVLANAAERARAKGASKGQSLSDALSDVRAEPLIGFNFGSGKIRYRASGGWMGPKGTDTIPTWLSPGEFVVNAAAAKRWGGDLEALNSGLSPSWATPLPATRTTAATSNTTFHQTNYIVAPSPDVAAEKVGMKNRRFALEAGML